MRRPLRDREDAMTQKRIPALFIRGGTSKGVFFHARDLPAETKARDEIFSLALGSPDPYGRQLNGMGGGISSLSKAVVIAPSEQPGIDVEYTFGQVDVSSPIVDYGATCGNLSSAVGPFAVDEGLVDIDGPDAVVRVYNTNTDKVFESRFTVRDGCAEVLGDFEIPGVAGTGAPIRLDFLDPGGAATGSLLPTGNAIDELDVPGLGPIPASLVDATNALVFVAAADLGLTGTEHPKDIDADAGVMEKLESIRAVAGAAMGIAATPGDVTAHSKASPKIGMVGPPRDYIAIDGATHRAGDMDIIVRTISMERTHLAVPLTGGLCLTTAARIEGTVPHKMVPQNANPDGDLRVGTPSGIIPFNAVVEQDGNGWHAERVVAYRTSRRLMEGSVLIPGD